MRQNVIIFVLSVAVLVVAGCGGTKAKTPEDALKNLCKSLKDEDSDAFIACFNDPKNLGPSLEKLFTSLTELPKYEKTRIKYDGKDTLKDVGGAKLADRIIKWLDEPRFKTEGKKATCTLKDGKTRLEFVQADAGWVIEPKGLIEAISENILSSQVAALGVEPSTPAKSVP